MKDKSTESRARGSELGTLRLAVDIGGTFTDLAAFDEAGERLHFGKALSTHGSLVDGIRHTAEDAGVAFKDAYLFLHGSTIAINTLLERTGAQTALITTRGFRDVYEIGRINRPDAYNLFFVKHKPLVDRSWRVEVNERMISDGSVLEALDEEQVKQIARDLRERDVQSVAVMLLHSYQNPQHEQRVKQILESELPNVFLTASHELTQEYREFERTSTVVANAYVGPTVQTYLGELETYLEKQNFPGDFYAVQSTGGLFPVSDARQYCVRMLESGPAAGVIGTQALCRQLSMPDAIAFDMGGTTAKAGVIQDYTPLTTSHALIGSYDRALPIQIPMIDIFEVGTGGGSIAKLAEGNALRVGPQSAGSMPGPACYNRGGEFPTVTDANLLLGRLDPDHFLGGSMPLNRGAANAAMTNKVAAPLGIDAIEAADGVLRIAVTAMSYAVKGVTTERGLDAGSFAMVVYGGAGPLHASAIAKELGIKRVLIPFAPGHFSAYGMLFSDLRYDYVRSCFQRLASSDFAAIQAMYKEMEDRGVQAIAASAVVPDQVSIIRYADMRYVGQEHAVTVELPVDVFETEDRAQIKRKFDEVHLQRYGTSAPEESAELVSLRSTVLGVMRKPPQQAIAAGSEAPAEDALARIKDVYFREVGFVKTPVYSRVKLQRGNRIDGPALIEEHASTTVLHPDDKLVVDAFGNLDITIGSSK
ncbi:hydantoinase/oxoprolinase family protein [Burkholderia plantarii]|uniref:hydantoinase/oxoprolinase family protein n=1 Tax=Burkholderia plantarii TaxID=41899 RepID=UPI0006D89F16|nr:hydantoinase/oxoprolinase family protein [Burkholderia plantarii]ALK30105.1 N-methylhydantoinase A/acetone carboxylase, beta subunit [Burkholderia plantarii]GLZ22067.1 5-oxoprolinase [Burkholderia plantarii]